MTVMAVPPKYRGLGFPHWVEILIGTVVVIVGAMVG
jgi:hypothetical protein